MSKYSFEELLSSIGISQNDNPTLLKVEIENKNITIHDNTKLLPLLKIVYEDINVDDCVIILHHKTSILVVCFIYNEKDIMYFYQLKRKSFFAKPLNIGKFMLRPIIPNNN